MRDISPIANYTVMYTRSTITNYKLLFEIPCHALYTKAEKALFNISTDHTNSINCIPIKDKILYNVFILSGSHTNENNPSINQ